MANSRRKRNFRNRLYANLKTFLDEKLVQRGWYDNIASGETDWHGNNLSQLFPVQTDPMYPVDSGSNVHVWQGYRKNWVGVESGTTLFSSGLTSPTIARSGMWNSAQHGSTTFDGTNGIAFDFRNGRMIVESGIPFTTTVEVPHSTKEVWIDTLSRDLITNQITVLDNTKRIVINNSPSGEIHQLPAIFIEIAETPEPTGMQLGGGIVINYNVLCHIASNNRHDKDELIDFVTQRTSETITMIDFDQVPSQTTQRGDFTSNFATLETLRGNYKDRQAYIHGVKLLQHDDIAEDGYYTAILRMDIEIRALEAL